ncbi:MAG: chemotaxis protein CheW, partial [Thermoanaerobaculia bacterium]
VDAEEYALPLTSIIETIHFAPGDGHQMNNAGVFTWRGRVLPLIDLGVVNGSASALRDRGYVAVIEADNRRRGVIVDEVTGIREIVVKALDSSVGTPAGISGATILGDGRVVLILDPKGLVTMSPRVGQPDPETQEVQA